MEFVNPGFLYGLFAISIPILIHLFNFRRFKKVYFSNVSFIKELKLQTQKQSRLKHLLILFLRILSIVTIVLAFAQPYFPVSQKIVSSEEKNVVSVFLDNSFSMQAISDKGILLDEAKGKALEIASVYKDTDIFQLLTNDLEGRDNRFVSKDEFIDRVNEIQVSPSVRTLEEIMTRQKKLFSEQPGRFKTSYIISDFQQSLLDHKITGIDSVFRTILIPIEAVNTDNLYIDSCWYESPVLQLNQIAKLNVKIVNSSEKNYERIPIKLTINNQQRALASFDIKAHSSAEVQMPYSNSESGIQNGKLEIDDFSVTFDDKLYFSGYSASQVPVLCINGIRENLYLNSLFEFDSLIRFENVQEGNIAFTDFRNFRLIILNELTSISSGLIQQLSPYVKEGGSLALIPPPLMNAESYNELLSTLHAGSYGYADTSNTRISFINLDHQIYYNVFDEIPENIDLPVVYKHYSIQYDIRTLQETLLKMQNGGTFLNVFMIEKGRVYLFAVPFDPSFSNFQEHAIFVPTLYNIAVTSVLKDKLYFTIGKDDVINVGDISIGNEETLRLKDEAAEFEVIPEHRRTNNSLDLFLHQQIKNSGNYYILREDKPIKGVSFNYDRKESEMTFYSSDELQRFIKDNQLNNIQIFDSGDKPFIETLSEFNKGIRLWKLFVVLALAFLLIESILLRMYK